MSKLTVKIPALVFLAALVAGLGNSLTGIILSSKAQNKAATTQLETVTRTRATALETYLKAIQEDLVTLSSSPVAYEAIVDFKRG